MSGSATIVRSVRGRVSRSGGLARPDDADDASDCGLCPFIIGSDAEGDPNSAPADEARDTRRIGASSTPPVPRPNILLLCTDQQRYDALGAAGNDHIRTPHLDRLAAQGARFTTCFTQSPICAPSRGSLMTGRYSRHHGLWANGVDMDPEEQF